MTVKKPNAGQLAAAVLVLAGLGLVAGLLLDNTSLQAIGGGLVLVGVGVLAARATTPAPVDVKLVSETLNSEEMKAERTELAKFLSPRAGFDRLDTYGKWLFGLVTVLFGLATAGGIAGFVTPRGWGSLTVALAFLCSGVALAAAALSLAPRWLTPDRTLKGMLGAVATSYEFRRRSYGTAAAFSAMAITFAGLTPVASEFAGEPFWTDTPASPPTAFAVTEDGKLSITVDGVDLEPFSDLTVAVATVGCDDLKPADLPIPTTTTTTTAPSAPTSAPAAPAETAPAGTPNTETKGDDASANASAASNSAAPAAPTGASTVLMPVARATADKDGKATVKVELSEAHALKKQPYACVTWRGDGVDETTTVIDTPVYSR